MRGRRSRFSQPAGPRGISPRNLIVTLPIAGTADALRANAWMIQQALAAGVHGILLCNAESPEAARLMIEASRYPFAPRVEGLAQGTRGNGSQAYASRMWGVSADAYMRIADPWPMNPDGELLFGLKIENPRAHANVESSVRVPGIAFAEWGPGDHGFYLLGRPGTYKGGGETSPQMAAVRRRVLNATKAAGIKFLNACTENNVIDQLKDGVMICTGGDSPAADPVGPLVQTGWYTRLVEADVRKRFERIEAILEAIARRQDRADRRQDRADRRQDRFDKQLQAAAARQDRFDRQLEATARLVAEGIKIVRTLARDTRELQRSQKAFLNSLRQGGNGRSPHSR